jgi:PAS domain S-box-containing protein
MEVSLTHFLTALGSGGVATVLTIATKFYLDLRKAKQDEGSQKSTTTVAEWTKTSEEWSKLVDRLSRQMTEMQSQIAVLVRENSRWQVENEYLRGELRVRDGIIKQMRAGMPSTQSDAIIVTCDRGFITQVNSAAALLFHYTEEELIGKPANVLIPERLRAQNDADLQAIVQSGIPPDPTKVIQTIGLTREGDEFPIDAQVTTWKSGPRTYYGAAIRRRTDRLTPPAAIAPEVMPAIEEIKGLTDAKARRQ